MSSSPLYGRNMNSKRKRAFPPLVTQVVSCMIITRPSKKFFKMVYIFFLKLLLNILQYFHWVKIKEECQQKEGKNLFFTIDRKLSLLFFSRKGWRSISIKCPLVALLTVWEIVLKRIHILLNWFSYFLRHMTGLKVFHHFLTIYNIEHKNKKFYGTIKVL